MNKVGRYLVVKCPNCGEVQCMESRNFLKSRFKCKYCRKSRKLKQDKTFGFAIKVLWHGDSPTAASKICIKLKENKNGKLQA